ncbi:LAFA_0D05710g1_1 [Lachancea sp. 'fantastica']|nr:LAFA_0D05710g1_1 [Lachancea sp. 'fantastica']
MSSIKKWLSRTDKFGKQRSEKSEKPSSGVKEVEKDTKDAKNQEKADSLVSAGDKLLHAVLPGESSKTLVSQDAVDLPGETTNAHFDKDTVIDDGATGSPSALSDTVSIKSDFERFSLVRPQITPLMPFGDGSNKVFGYENFGNTCYCNSVLQVMYNLPELRNHILEFPARSVGASRKRKFEMPGLKPRIFDDTSFLPQCNTTDSSKKSNGGGGGGCNSNSQNSSKDTGSRKSSAPHSRDRDNYRSSTTSRNHRSHSSATVHGTVMAADAITEKLHEGYTRIVVGRVAGKNGKTKHSQSSGCVSNSSAPSSASSSSFGSSAKPMETSSEERKKAALIRGPVLNIDHNLKDYLAPNEKPGLYTSLKDVYESIAENRCFTGVVSPIQFVETLKRENVLFSTMMHQDAHEFLNYLLNEISDYTNTHHEQGNEEEMSGQTGNFVDDLFKGTLTNRTKCLTCDNETFRNEPFLDFAIEVKNDEETDIQTTLSDYHHREMLNGANKFYCDECCGLQEAERVVGLKKLPFYLSLHMKRFKYSEEQNCNTKLFNKIHYPLNLTVCSTFDSSVCKRYELIGLVVHMGGGPHHGHYVSLCKTDKFGWLLFDDETVETVEESTVLKFVGNSDDLTTAYLLFYREVTDFREESDKPEKRQVYTEGVDQLIKLDELTRDHLDQNGELEGVPEERLSSKTDSKASKRRSRLFSFRRSTKD